MKNTENRSARTSLRTGLRAGVMAADRNGDGILDSCTIITLPIGNPPRVPVVLSP